MFTLAVQAGKLHAKPHIPMLREDNVRRGFFEARQFDAVRAHLPETLRPVVTFAYLTGWRMKSEILPIEWRQVDWQGRTRGLQPGLKRTILVVIAVARVALPAEPDSVELSHRAPSAVDPARARPRHP